MEDFERLTALQKEFRNNSINTLGQEEIHQSWFCENTVDAWRHRRMYETIASLAKYYKDAKWLSIGDGRYGLDSVRLNKLFQLDVFPTDIAGDLLQEGKERGLFAEYGVENAEALTFANNSFDVLFCKESFHHFPRPMIALYEMIRVARQAVVLIEPNDYKISNKKRYLLSALKIVLNKLLRKKYTPYSPYNTFSDASFEKSGNFVYSISNTEIYKITHAMNLGGMAYYTFNDSYIEGVEFVKADESNPVFSKIKQSIEEQDNWGSKGITTTVIFKAEIDATLKAMMIDDGYDFPPRKENPRIMSR